MNIYVPGYGNNRAKLMIVGDYPGAEEVNSKPPLPFLGQEGNEIRTLLKDAGVSWTDIYATNIYKYRPPISYKRGIKVEHWSKWQECYAQIWAEIEEVNPNIILTFGSLSFETLTGKSELSKQRGSILRSARQVNGRFIKVIPTIHPVNYLRPKGEGGVEYQARAYVFSDVEKAVRHSANDEFDVPDRTLKIIRNADELENFFYSYRDKREWASDIETSKTCIPVCISFACNRHYAVSVPLLNLSTTQQIMTTSDRVRVWRLIHEFFHKPGLRLIGQNFKFDHEKLNMLGFDIPYSAIYFDTQLAHRILFPEFPANLAFMTSVHTDEPYYKDEGSGFNILKDNVDRLLRYNAKDSVVTFEIYEALMSEADRIGSQFGVPLREFILDYIPKLYEFYARMENDGFKYNVGLTDKLWVKYRLALYELAIECQKRFGMVVNPNANNAGGQVHSFLFNRLKLPQRQKVDDETLAALFGNHAKYEEQQWGINYILDTRRIRKTISTYIEANPDFDGRMKTAYNIFGTETGRSSTNVLKSPLRPEQCGMPFQTLPQHGQFGPEINEALEADEGCVLGTADLSQSQARIVALLAKDYALLDRFDKTDIHWEMAGIAFSFDHKAVTYSSKDDPRRFCGKQCRHGMAFGMKKHRFAEHVNANIKRFGIPMPMISEYKAGEMLARAHRACPNIQGVFHREVIEHINKSKALVSPHGIPRVFYGRTGDDLYQEAYAHLPQLTEITHLRLAALRAWKRCPTIRWRIEKHDSLTWQSRREEFCEHASIIKEEMERPIDFERCSLQRNPLIIPAELEWGLNMKQKNRWVGGEI